jgi:hypothetical protein
MKLSKNEQIDYWKQFKGLDQGCLVIFFQNNYLVKYGEVAIKEIDWLID